MILNLYCETLEICSIYINKKNKKCGTKRGDGSQDSTDITKQKPGYLVW